jgi:hypothetical protein
MTHMVAENRGEHCLVREQASKGLIAQRGCERVVGRREEGEAVRHVVEIVEEGARAIVRKRLQDALKLGEVVRSERLAEVPGRVKNRVDNIDLKVVPARAVDDRYVRAAWSSA